jgi:hypothetical protein
METNIFSVFPYSLWRKFQKHGMDSPGKKYTLKKNVSCLSRYGIDLFNYTPDTHQKDVGEEEMSLDIIS